jgi:hypothetical protein
MKQAFGFVSGVFASDEAAQVGFMVIVYETEAQARGVAERIIVGGHPREGVTVTRVSVAEVAATA